MTSTFYEMAVKIVGNLPITAEWLYVLTTILLIICACGVFLIPILIISKKVGV